MTTIKSTIFKGVDGTVKKTPIDLSADLKPKQILLKITHSSLCGTDIHFIPAGLPLGHEGVGIVEKVGSEVTTLKVGDRAGIGYLNNSCGHCKYCLTGRDIQCYERNIFGDPSNTYGTFGEYFIGLETFIHPIPAALSSEAAAPLQCAGATVYSALIHNTSPGDRVGVLGIGGLGHLAIQFASKLGFETVVFSTSEGKRKEAESFGATEFYLLSEPEKVVKPIDVLVVTSSSYPDWGKFMDKNILARTASILALSAPSAPLQLPSFPFFMESYNLKTSLVASRGVHDEMLRFAAQHDIKPATETFAFTEEGFKEAYDKMMSGKLRYRGVLVA